MPLPLGLLPRPLWLRPLRLLRRNWHTCRIRLLQDCWWWTLQPRTDSGLVNNLISFRHYCFDILSYSYFYCFDIFSYSATSITEWPVGKDQFVGWQHFMPNYQFELWQQFYDQFELYDIFMTNLICIILFMINLICIILFQGPNYTQCQCQGAEPVNF